MQHSRATDWLVLGCSVLLILAGASRLLAGEAQDDPQSRKGFYLSAQGVMTSGML